MKRILPLDAETAPKASALLGRLLPREKIAQLRCVRALDLLDGNRRLDPAKCAALMADGIGFVAQPGDFCHAEGLDAAEVARFCGDLQAWLREHTTSKLPALIHEECLSGATIRGETIFPQMLGLASTWNPSLAERMTERIGRRLRQLGVRAGLSPVLDLGRDARMGRIEETFGEDHVLAAAFGTAYVRGLQGSSLRGGIAATAKHFVGQGGNMGGRFPAAVRVGPREARHVWGYPFEAAIRGAGLRLVMPGYHEIDGVPCALNRELLRDLLRGKMGFEGVVVSDYFALKHLSEIYHVDDDPAVILRAALLAGIDVELPEGSRWAAALAGGVDPDPEWMRAIDEAVLRVLRLKEDLGLLEAEEEAPTSTGGDAGEDAALAREIAGQSLVLLSNPGGLLPLGLGIRRIAVLGANADSRSALCGDYSWPAAHFWQKKEWVPDSLPRWSVRDALQAETDLEVVESAEEADAVVLVLGEQAGLSSGEGKDRENLRLPGEQEELFLRVTSGDKPVVAVFLCGRPLEFARYAERVQALLVAWYPGQEGAAAIVDVLRGRINPSGRLPVSIAHHAGNIPCHYNRNDFSGYGAKDAAFPFGFGLGYTSFAMKLASLSTEAAGVRVCVQVSNTGPRSGVEIVQIYTRIVRFPCARAPWQLKAFRRVSLVAGEESEIEFLLPPDLLAEPDMEGNLLLPEGALRVAVGANARDLSEPMEVVWPRTWRGAFRRHYSL